jgi:hypothetical protein
MSVDRVVNHRGLGWWRGVAYESADGSDGFIAADASTIAVVTLAGDDVRPRRRREILHVREVG